MCELHAPPSGGFETLRVRQCVKRRRARMLMEAEKRALLVGNPSRLQETTQLIDRMARGRWPVLVLGETGTGKEVVARSIHSANPMGPFITVDCSSMVGPLMESELFGHVKGSFTGAIANKTGLLEL